MINISHKETQVKSIAAMLCLLEGPYLTQRQQKSPVDKGVEYVRAKRVEIALISFSRVRFPASFV